MRSLLDDPPMPVLAVATAPRCDPQGGVLSNVPETHLPVRGSFGFLESTRAASALGALDLAFLPRFARRLARLANGGIGLRPQAPAACLHAVPHSLDFAAVQWVAARLQLPMFLSVHDDPGYVLRGKVERSFVLSRLGKAWQGADQCFVICEEMGLEMCRRYGERPYVIVTDGLETIAPSPKPAVAGRLSVYFMGGASIPYGDNFQCLLNALAAKREEGIDARLITRAGRLPYRLNSQGVPIESRPWAPQAAVLCDFDAVDVAYLPLPFGVDHAEFARFSMSTKMVTYLGSGVPILFHGPMASAAGALLRTANAALLADSLDTRVLAETLAVGADRASIVAGNALRLARERFLLADVRDRFWHSIVEASGPSASPG
jgi:hypothetical protein